MLAKPGQTRTTHATSTSTFWVIGGGQFGRRAVELLKKDEPACHIVIIDKIQVQNLPDDIEIVCADGVEWFAGHFTPDANVQKIFPALPLHLAADWLKIKLTKEQRIVHFTEIPDEQLQHFPHPLRISPSRIVMSHADFLCPPNCAEPDNLCTYTRKPRPPALYSVLETMGFVNLVPLILRSRQFHAGVGGFFPEDLWRLLERTRSLPDTPLLIGTACKCHGIVDGLCHTMS